MFFLPNEVPEQIADAIQYLGGGKWQFNWKTPKSYARGGCRTMILTLADGSTHTAQFHFK